MKTALAALMLLAVALPVRAELRLAGQRSRIKEARTVVARSAEEFQQLWKQHNPAQAAPAVDFEKDIVVGVFLGQRRTGGTRVELTLMSDPIDSSKLVVFYKEVAPARSSFKAQVLTSPFELRAVPKTYAAVTFERDYRARTLADGLERFAADGGFDAR